MLSKELEFTLNIAFKEAREKRHEFMTVEHLLLVLLDNSSAVHALKACGADIERLRKELVVFIEETTPKIPLDDLERETQPTLGFQRVLQRAVFHVQSSGKSEVTGANVLAAIFSEQESQAVYFLKRENISRLDIVNYISHGIAKLSEEEEDGGGASGTGSHQPGGSLSEDDSGMDLGHRSPLETYTVNLNVQAKMGHVDPLIGRQNELERTIQVLCRRRKNNPLFVGEAGVGKTAIAEGLAKMIVEKKVPEILSNATVYALDLGVLLAGTKYRGDFEKRFKALLHQLKREPDAILFIDEIHTIIGAGAASGGVMDASNLLKPILASGELKCMGSTTYQEYRGIFEKERALSRRFQKIDIAEPSVEETVEILKGLKTRLESHHGVKYSYKALRSAAELGAKYLTDRFLPDKAIDIVDEAGAYQRLQPSSKRKKLISVAEIEQIVAKMARIPQKNISRTDREVLKNLGRDLKMVVFGQDEAIETLTSTITLSRSGLGDPRRPVGSFLFAGPTGVGKTEVTRQLAQLMGIPLVRFDMSEYMERHTVSRLIGAPPGYVGFDQGGLLTDAIHQNPHCVLLLDEIEKAHPDVYNLLLQVMDHGTLTDNNGRRSDFRHVLLVMTTNAGADRISRQSMGFKLQDHTTDAKDSIGKIFPPEFRNRLDATILFRSLNQDIIVQVVDKFIAELEGQLAEQGVTIAIDDVAREWFVSNGYDPTMGARPMGRLIQDRIKKPLAQELLFGRLVYGGHVLVTEKDGNIVLEFVHAPEKNEVAPVAHSQ